jgi:hypothetical protein
MNGDTGNLRGGRRRGAVTPRRRYTPVLLFVKPALLLCQSNEIISAVFLPAIFGVLRADRFFLAVANE